MHVLISGGCHLAEKREEKWAVSSLDAENTFLKKTGRTCLFGRFTQSSAHITNRYKLLKAFCYSSVALGSLILSSLVLFPHSILHTNCIM